MDFFSARDVAQLFDEGMPLTAAIRTAFLAAFATASVRFAWAGASAAVRWIGFRLSARTENYEIVLGPYQDVHHLIEKMSCLVIRYGNDQYLKTVASEQDRREGRLQNKKIAIQKRRQKATLRGVFKIPVHRRLGTQFICAIDCTSSTNAELLQKNKELWTLTEGTEATPPRREGKRVFVLLLEPEKHGSLKLARVDDVHTTDGKPIYNNMYYPF